MPGKTARALCPVCQEPMPPDETECENCGAFVIDEAVVRLCRAFGIPRQKALALFEKGFRHPKQLQDRDVDGVLARGEDGLLYLCTNCGGFVATGDSKCARCGAELEDGSAEPAAGPEDVLDQVLCPICGADNDASWKECEICGEPLGGTEEPPGGVQQEVSPPEAAPEPSSEPTPDLEEVPSRAELEAIDEILSDLDAPPRRERSVRPIQRLPKVTRQKAREAGPKPAPRSRPAVRPVRRTSARPPIRPVPRPPPKPVRRVSRTVPNRPAEKPETTLRPEFAGGLVVASAVTLYTSVLFGMTDIAWGAAAVLAVFAAAVAALVLPRRPARPPAFEGVLLLAGAGLGGAAAVAPTAAALGLMVVAAVAFALATRRVLRTPARTLLAAAAAIPLLGLGLAAAMGLPLVATPAWAFGLLAAVPWPAALVAEGFRERRGSVALHRELARADQNVERRDFKESLRDYDRAIAVAPKGAPGEDVPWYGKGASLILLGRYEEALEAIDRALDLNPRNEVAWLNKGNALTKLGQLVDALRCYNAAIKVNPRYEVAWNNKGNALARLGHYQDALRCYERALEIDPSYRGAWVNKGYVLTRLGRYDEATSCADRALRLREHAAREVA